jgi:hypothetical protein
MTRNLFFAEDAAIAARVRQLRADGDPAAEVLAANSGLLDLTADEIEALCSLFGFAEDSADGGEPS